MPVGLGWRILPVLRSQALASPAVRFEHCTMLIVFPGVKPLHDTVTVWPLVGRVGRHRRPQLASCGRSGGHRRGRAGLGQKSSRVVTRFPSWSSRSSASASLFR